MCNQIIGELNILKTNFDNNELVSYQLLLIKIKQIIDMINNKEIDESDKITLSDFMREYLVDLGLNRILTIASLNQLFTPELDQIDIENSDIYITIFNIFVEELADTDNVFSQKLNQCIESMLIRITNTLDDNNESSKVDFINENNNILIDTENSLVDQQNEINYQNSYPSMDIEINNKTYLKEYIVRKNLKPYKCDICGLSSWQNEPLMLYLYAKNHIYSNKNINNLMFLCPNCYSQIGE